MTTKTNDMSRRNFLGVSGAGASFVLLSGVSPTVLVADGASVDGKPAILGGTPVGKVSRPAWPILQGDEEKMLLEVLRTGQWFRSDTRLHMVDKFEEEYAAMNKAKFCIATNSGTSALVATLSALDIGPGDEVVTSPYTFIATINCVLAHYALPVPVDVDPDSFQLDAKAADAACTENTRCLLPVHIGGAPADMDAFAEIGRRRKIKVVEDACQAHLGRWRDKNLGTIGDAGCFSFQVTKNLSCGDGGAVLTDDEFLAEKIFQCHNNCRNRKVSSLDFTYGSVRADNRRMTEFQGAVLRGQMKGIEAYAETRWDNAVYLDKRLADIPGILPAKYYPGTTRGAVHLYMFRVDRDAFGLDRDRLAAALTAEKIPYSTGYGAKDWIDFVRKAYSTKAAGRIYSKKTLDDWAERVGELPRFKRLCGEALWFTQDMMLGPRENMDVVAAAIRRIRKHAGEIAGL